MDEDERADTLAFLERHGLAYVSRRHAAHAGLERLAAGRRGDAPASRTSASTGGTRRRGTSAAESAADRFDWLYSEEELGEWVEPLARLADEAEEVYAMFNNNRDDFAPRSAQILRGLLDEAGVPATGGVEPPPTELTCSDPLGWRWGTGYVAACACSRSSTSPAVTGGGGIFERRRRRAGRPPRPLGRGGRRRRARAIRRAGTR